MQWPTLKGVFLGDFYNRIVQQLWGLISLQLNQLVSALSHYIHCFSGIFLHQYSVYFSW